MCDHTLINKLKHSLCITLVVHFSVILTLTFPFFLLFHPSHPSIHPSLPCALGTSSLSRVEEERVSHSNTHNLRQSVTSETVALDNQDTNERGKRLNSLVSDCRERQVKFRASSLSQPTTTAIYCIRGKREVRSTLFIDYHTTHIMSSILLNRRTAAATTTMSSVNRQREEDNKSLDQSPKSTNRSSCRVFLTTTVTLSVAILFVSLPSLASGFSYDAGKTTQH